MTSNEVIASMMDDSFAADEYLKIGITAFCDRSQVTDFGLIHSTTVIRSVSNGPGAFHAVRTTPTACAYGIPMGPIRFFLFVASYDVIHFLLMLNVI